MRPNILRRAVSIRPLAAVLDLLLAAGLFLASPPFKLFARVGAARLPASTRTLRRLGVFPIRDHYYQPLFHPRHLKRPLDSPRALPAVDMRLEDQIALLKELDYAGEIRRLDWSRRSAGNERFQIDNGAFEAGDAEVLYSVLRHFKPSRIVEIGSGESTRVVKQATSMNTAQGAQESVHTCIEPYEMPWLESLGVHVVRELAEDADPRIFDELSDGDLLFIDSSHMIRPQGDVLFEYLELLPRLQTGVIVHVHDIFTPRDYPSAWVIDDVRMWNEQYLLEALLSDSDRYEVLLTLNHLKNDRFDDLQPICPHLTRETEPGSFYLRVR